MTSLRRKPASSGWSPRACPAVILGSRRSGQDSSPPVTSRRPTRNLRRAFPVSSGSPVVRRGAVQKISRELPTVADVAMQLCGQSIAGRQEGLQCSESLPTVRNRSVGIINQKCEFRLKSSIGKQARSLQMRPASVDHSHTQTAPWARTTADSCQEVETYAI
jgi:hypothetical protein